MTAKQRLEAHLPKAASADHVDLKTAESDADLRSFLAALFSYSPGWVRLLYRARGVLAALLGLKREPYAVRVVRPEDVPFAPGERLRFFVVQDASEEERWIAQASDAHLTAALAVLVEPLGNGRRRYRVFTAVWHTHWTGPLYFNLIRPFHHLLVAAMVRAAARASS